LKNKYLIMLKERREIIIEEKNVLKII